MRRRIAASVGLLGLIGAGWLGVRDDVIGGEPPVTPATVPADVPTEPPMVQPFFERIDANPSKRSKRQTAVKTKVGTAPATVVITQEEPELLPLVLTAEVPMSVPATGATFDTLCQRLQPVLNKLFPKCDIKLNGHRDGLVIKGSAASAQEAATIVAAVQTVIDLNSPEGHPQSRKVVNLLEIPGEAQVRLHVKIIEADRSAVTETFQRLSKSEQEAKPEPRRTTAIVADSTSQSGIFSTHVVDQAAGTLLTKFGVKPTGEPLMTVLSGQTASYISGGEFAVPTIVGVGEAKKTTTSFRSFGTSLIAKPTVIDDEQINLELTCESSRLDQTKTVAGIPGLNTRRVRTQLLVKPRQTVVLVLPVLPTSESDADPLETAVRLVTQSLGAAQKENEPGSAERCLFVAVTPEILKSLETNEVPPQPMAIHPRAGTTTAYVPYSDAWNAGAGPTPQMFRGASTPVLRDLLLRTPLPATEWSQPMAATPLPPFDPFGNPIQQLGGWQPMPSVMTPWPSAGPSPSNVPAKTSRLEHLKSALKHLQATDLPDQVAAIQNEIVCEQKVEIRRELQQREQQLEMLQRQIEELRRSLSSEEAPRPE